LLIVVTSSTFLNKKKGTLEGKKAVSPDHHNPQPSIYIDMYTPTHYPNNRENREIYQTNPLSLPLSKHSLPRQQQALTMNKLEKIPTSNPPPHTHESVEKHL